MSLQICPNCKKTNPYWKIYKSLNMKRFEKGMSIDCDFCKKKMNIDLDFKEKYKMYCSGFLWMLLPMIIIYLVYTDKLSYLNSILIVTGFHFSAMYYLIKKMNYKITG